jgi:RHS repeat-associated protein
LEKPAHLGTGQGSKADEILDERPYLMGLRVRPKEGAWVFAGGDGAVSPRRILVAILLAGALAAPAVADVHPNTAPGFPVEQSFHVGDIDSINLFNNGLTLTIPIGGSYPVNAGFSYGLKLVYNSNPWLFKTVKYPNPADPANDLSRTQAYPTPCSNAGLGWRVSLGRMNPPCQVPDANDTYPLGPVYQDENGTDHVFYPTLHPGDAEDAPVSGVSDIQYTRDGSYLRLKVPTSGGWVVEFPDGSTRSFGADGMPTSIQDPFGNFLSISYGIDMMDGLPVWVLQDSQGRAQKVHFRTDLSPYAQVVNRIELTAFAGAKATYQFNYTVQPIGRACPHNDTDQMGSVGNSVSVPLLTSVILPDNSSWSNTANDYVIALPQDGVCTENAGEITAWTLPTLGRMEWTWQKVYFPTGSTTKKHLQTNPGVATRTMRNPNGTVLGTWTYISAPGFPDALTSREHSTSVLDPLNHRTVSYFSTALDLSYTGWSTYEYSLPFTRNTTLNVAPGVDLNLSRQVYDGLSPSATLLRSEYVLYERDPVYAVSPPDIYNTNRRALRSRTVYNDDGGNFSGAVSSGFDGLGHYRTQQTEGSLPGSNVRTHFGNYNPGQGTYTVNAAGNTGSGYSLFPSSSAWVLEAPVSVSDSEGSATAQTELCYAPGSTAVTRKRVHRLDGAAQGAQDLVSVYVLENTGNVMNEKSYGGDAQGGIGAGNLCALALPASPEHQIDHTYSLGVRATSKYAGTNFFVLNQGIDSSTGLPLSSADTAGLTTNYEYDALGRLLWSKPPQGGWTEYVYTPAAGSVQANATVRQRTNGGAQILAVHQIVFDPFGRVYQEFKTLPNGTSAKRQTTYDIAGNKSTVSEWTVGSPTNQTTFLNYDAFGRPGTIRPPDGAAHDVAMTYHGVRQVDRTVKIATAQGSETSATTTEIYDRHGRLVSVAEPSGSGGTNVTTFYGYDVGNRLASVSTTASSVTQTRSFSYDRAGLLQSETHPEKGASGNGAVTYPSYDSHGHALQKVDGPNNLTFIYDPAERLRQVHEKASGLLLKDFLYVDTNGANDWSQGKLRQASRYNYVTLSGSPHTVQITETYTYGGRDGRVSRRDMQATTDTAPGESFTQGFTYNDLGLVSSLDYPRCTHAGCTSPAIFSDVPTGAPYQREIEAIYPNVTAGCAATTPPAYCPGTNTTRGEMAVFLLRAKEGPAYVPPACTTAIFADVPCSDGFAPWIQELYHRGVTGGCATNPLRYCPGNTVSNAQMSVFLLQMMGVAAPACTTAPFADVPCTAFAASFIAEESRRQITAGCGGGNFCPNDPVTRASMAGLLVHAFDIPVGTDPGTQRSVQLAYTQGLLTGVTSGATTYGTISYYPNLLVSQIAHGNGVTETQGNDPNEMRRPSSLAASGPWASWSSGGYSYDGTGNVKAIGTSWFTYDPVSRLVSSTLFDGPTGGGTQKQQSYTFDAFGNLQSIGGTSGRSTPTSSQTNRLSGAAVYDAAGNLTNWNGATYTYDHFNQMTQMVSGSESWAYLYTADDERIWSYDTARNISHWTVRDLGGKVLRDYLNNAGRWSVGTDYLYRDGLLLAAETQTGQRHFHLDHLGTPRLVTRGSGDRVAYHVYYPFGEEATAFNQDTERMKFTGHERDLASPAGAGDDLDYMHARHESPVTGRFLSSDRNISFAAATKHPQLWNRYSYVMGNPGSFVDLNGLEVIVPDWMQPAVKAGLQNSQEFKRLYERLDKDTRVKVDFARSAKPPTGARYSQNQRLSRSNGLVVRIESTVNVPVGKQGDVALVGHELKHVEEVIDTNKTLQERYRENDPTVRAVGNGAYESQGALAAEETVRSQMQALQLPPGSVEFDSSLDLFAAGKFVLEGICIQLAPR